MNLQNVEFIQSAAKQDHFSAKAVFNEKGAIFFPVSKQHRDMKGPGISYEDDNKGNALAAMLAPGKMEIRYHQNFSDGRVVEIVKSLFSSSSLSFMVGWEVTYQGRKLLI